MAHGFVAYIDESGDEGFVFREPPERASSQWFTLSALFCTVEEEIAELKKLDAVIRPIEAARGSVIHFHKLNHEQRIAVSAALGQSEFAFLTINTDKPQIQSPQLKTGYALYFYMTRYLLERLSWLARDAPRPENGSRQIKIIFSNRSRMSYDDLRSYVTRLRGMETSIYWPAIDEALITTRTHKELVGLRAVDAVASVTCP